MSAYENAYKILGDVREGLDENQSGLRDGTATYGVYSNSYILNKINRAQRYIYAVLFTRIPEEFLTSASLTGSSGVFTLPWDVGQVRRFEDENGIKVQQATVDHRPTYGSQGSENLYYHKGNTLVLTDTSVGDTYTLWYYKKPLDLDQGKASANSTLASSAKVIADYYNGLVLENITAGSYGTITDYTAARVVTGPTLSEDNYYGMVSNLPEPFHLLIAPLAVMICKAQHPVSPEKPTKAEENGFARELNQAIDAFGNKQGDIPPEDLFTDFNTGPGWGGFNVPGQGYPIF